MRLAVTGAAIMLVVAGCAAESSLPRLDTLAERWNQLSPGGEAVCSDSSAYSFFVRPASRDSVLIHLQGGGQCWRGEDCSPDRGPTYDISVDDRDNPSGWPGIWDVDDPENPFANYTQVLVPNCTGDLFLGNKVTTYDLPGTESSPAKQVTIHHRGYANAMAALDWVFRNFSRPNTVFLSGTSAGAASISFYGPAIQQRYPEAYVVALGDAIAGNRGVDFRPAWEAWGTLDVLSHHDGYEGVTTENLGLDLLFQAAAQEEPRLRLAQISSVGDEAQLSFLRRNGMNDTILLPLLDANESAIRRVAPTYRSFIYGGTDHVILMAPTFYYVEADGKRVRDWVAELAAGHDPGDVRCTVCDRPSFRFTETDLRILQRTNQLLSSASSWRQEDDGRCDDDDANGRWSLFCALGRASQEVAGTFSQTAALSEVWLRIIELNPDKDRWVSFRDFNNAPETSFGDIQRLLQTVTAQVQKQGGAE